jgi:hypothetical protein
MAAVVWSPPPPPGGDPAHTISTRRLRGRYPISPIQRRSTVRGLSAQGGPGLYQSTHQSFARPAPAITLGRSVLFPAGHFCTGTLTTHPHNPHTPACALTPRAPFPCSSPFFPPEDELSAGMGGMDLRTKSESLKRYEMLRRQESVHRTDELDEDGEAKAMGDDGTCGTGYL